MKRVPKRIHWEIIDGRLYKNGLELSTGGDPEAALRQSVTATRNAWIRNDWDIDEIELSPTRAILDGTAPITSMIRKHVFLPISMSEDLETISANSNVPVAWLIRQAINDWLNTQ